MNEDEVIAFIRSKYGSLESPNFSFVGEALSGRPYEDLIKRIGRLCAVEEDTDPNDDVSFGYILTAGEQQWLLRISMLGPYGVFFRLTNGDEMEIIEGERQAASTFEKEVLSLLSDTGVRLLSLEELSLRVPLKLFNADPEDVRLYQALFADIETLPWEGSI